LKNGDYMRKNYIKIKFNLKIILKYIVIIIFLLYCVTPIIWILLASFKSNIDILEKPPLIIFKPTFKNYISMVVDITQTDRWARYLPILKYFKNSLIVSVASTIISLVLGASAAYYIRNTRTKLVKNLEFWILSTRFAPPIVFIIPFFIMFNKLRMHDTLYGLILLHLTITLPLITWIMINFLAAVPDEIREASFIDGASHYQCFWKIILPLTMPGIVSCTILSFIYSWNDLLFALTLTSRNATTVPSGLQGYMGFTEVSFGQIASGGILAITPVVVITLIMGRHIAKGLTLGALKG